MKQLGGGILAVVFTWDRHKAERNVQKHGVHFSEGCSVLDDPLSTTFPDEDHPADEQRFVTVGMSESFRLMVVVHTDRGNTVRMISARVATRRERQFYEETRH